MRVWTSWSLWLWAVVGLWSSAVAELFSSMADLESLLTTEQRAIGAINDYIAKEEKRLQDLRRLASQPILEDADLSQIRNPIGSFQFIKSWINAPVWVAMRKNHAEEVMESLAGMPDEGDLEGAAKGLVRLQTTYDIPTKDLAYGYPIPALGFNGSALSVSDCFELGKVMYRAENFYYALEWLEEAWQKTLRADHIDTAGKVDILDYLCWAYEKTGNVQRAYWTAKKSAALQGTADQHTLDNIHYLQEALQEASLPAPKSLADVPPIMNMPPEKQEEMKLYDDLCVAQTPPPPSPKLFCFYKTNSVSKHAPFLRYAPIKEELLSLDPPVSVFRDFITDNEVAHLISLAAPKLMRALVVDRTQGFKERPAEYRVAKNAWMREIGDPILDAVNDRIELASGLCQRSAEFLQMANYGIAGQYEPHFDMSTESEDGESDPYDDDLGNRIATLLVYFNDPVKGGGTVFGDLNLHVEATKGSAVFWYNLLKSGKPDLRMRHAACPVLMGQKWVGNKWIRQKGQELRRTCSLDEEL